MDVPEIKLVAADEISGMPEGIGELKGLPLAVKRFDRWYSYGEARPDAYDRCEQGPIHIEDFAHPENKYNM
jgi:serine/threonine-protein kinase HipA